MYRTRESTRRSVCGVGLILLAGLASTSCGGEQPAAATEWSRRGGDREIAGFVLVEHDVDPAPGSRAPERAWRELRRPGRRSVVLTAPPERIVSQTLASDEILLTLCPQRLSAVSNLALDERYSLEVPAARRIGRYVASSAEQILSLRPDLVVMAGYSTPETRRQLVQAGAPLIRLDGYDSVRAVRENIELLAFATGTDAAGAEMIAELDRRIEAAARSVAPRLAGREVRLAAWDEGVVAARGTIFDDLARTLGLANVPAREGLYGWPRVSLETLVAWPLDVLVVPADPGTEAETERRLRESPVLGASSAVRAGRIAVVSRAVFSTVSQHTAELAERLAEAVTELASTTAAGEAP